MQAYLTQYHHSPYLHLTSKSTTEQISQIVATIQNSTPALVAIVQYLLLEFKAQKKRDVYLMRCDFKRETYKYVKETHIKGLYTDTQVTLTGPKDLAGKRKHSITHFDGIPVPILSSPSSSCYDTSVCTPRKVITKRKIKQLDDCFAKMNIGQTDTTRDDLSTSRDSGNYKLEYHTDADTAESLGIDPTDVSDEDYNYDWDSDDDEDVVFLMTP
ncbi:uncharacterized protein L201_004725 [Kwoniella dendrophila CBS 6074]|uniref:Uncharacterized protein n=1 Tax=Kwoniella dendrophila CBS 6074 TaxID=1295534 RepID=A0AAX4JY55_9TREE